MTKYKVCLCLIFLLAAGLFFSGRAVGAGDTEDYIRTVEKYVAPTSPW